MEGREMPMGQWDLFSVILSEELNPIELIFYWV